MRAPHSVPETQRPRSQYRLFDGHLTSSAKRKDLLDLEPGFLTSALGPSHQHPKEQEAPLSGGQMGRFRTEAWGGGR